jgi:hypothetical protein
MVGMSTEADRGTTNFLNVDLDIFSRSRLDPLVSAFGQKVSVLYVGRERRLYSAHLELAVHPKGADAAIRGLAALVHGLPSAKRKLWDAATRRDFNIGVEVADGAPPFEIELAARTIEIVTSLNARIVFTVYAPGPPISTQDKSTLHH